MIEKILVFDLEELLENSEEATELNNLCRQIISDENNNLDDYYSDDYKTQSIINNQIVGTEDYKN